MKVLTDLYRSAKFIATRIPGLEEKYRAWVAWRVLRHWIALRVDPRVNSTFTGFLRLPSQFEALTGPVVNYIRKEGSNSPIRIVVMGCSNGAEAYTIASMLMARCPGIDFLIDAYDINPDICEKARSARYKAGEVLNNQLLTAEFIQATFEVRDDTYHVKERVAARTRFHVADVLDPELVTQVGQCDILFAQNFLFHLDRKTAVRAFENLCSLLKTRAVFFVDGMDIGLRQKWTRVRHLTPLDFRIEEIHNEARRARAPGWPYSYWGLEPFMTFADNWQHRYATIYLKGGSRNTRSLVGS
jgi:chemotaxis methyl-accepting protein methylase